jgi:hypothetical protein
MLAAGIQALVIPWTAEPDDTGSGQTVDLDGLIEAAIASAAGRRAQRDLARAATRLSLAACRRLPSVAARLLLCKWVPSVRWELASVFWARSTPLVRLVRKLSMT